MFILENNIIKTKRIISALDFQEKGYTYYCPDMLSPQRFNSTNSSTFVNSSQP